jgi:hypothetical protein
VTIIEKLLAGRHFFPPSVVAISAGIALKNALLMGDSTKSEPFFLNDGRFATSLSQPHRQPTPAFRSKYPLTSKNSPPILL